MEQCAATGAVAGLVVAGPDRAAVGGAVGVVVNEVEEDKEQNDCAGPIGSASLQPHMRLHMIRKTTLVLAALAALAGCGTNMEQRAATGAATGLIIAGPVGAAVGAVAGVVVNEAEEGK